ncbi:MAG: FecR domain-containing protein [Anaerolineales bacterium]|nr:FecR domain-containing protein [Anaerolineales bacterium]
MMRSLFARLGWLLAAALLLGACQRNLVYLPTPTGGPIGPDTERKAVFSDLAGDVDVRSSANGEWQAASLLTPLPEGSEVRTGPDGRATLTLTEGSKVYVTEDTEFSITQLNPYLDSLLTTLDLKQGLVWVLLNGGALDVNTPFGIALARSAYLSVEYRPDQRQVNVTCLEGVCGFGSVAIPSGYKLEDAADNANPDPMTFADYGAWGVNVPESTQFAYLGTEAVAQGSATVPVVASATPTHTAPPSATAAASETAAPTEAPSDTATLPPEAPTLTPEPPTAAATETFTPEPPTHTPVPSPTLPVFQATVTPRPFTPLPAAPIMGYHTVLGGETIFCIGRGYGVLPGAIAQANNLPATFNVRAGQVLAIPQVQWGNISPGPVCAPQFPSLYPGLPVATNTPAFTSTPAAPPLTIALEWHCVDNCGSSTGSYTIRVTVSASGGVLPYSYNPGQVFDVIFPHCTTGLGNAGVISADGQEAVANWSYTDVACAP